jgi:hypothetical protein
MAFVQALMISDWVSWALEKAQMVFYSEDLEFATVRQFTSSLTKIQRKYIPWHSIPPEK